MFDFVKKHNRGAVASAKTYAASKPWRGDVEERQEKLRDFHEELCAAYGISPRLALDDEMTKTKGTARGWYDEEADAICLHGAFSVLTYLHFFAHALEISRHGDLRAENYPRRWSQGLFSKAFPKSWAALVNRDAAILTRYA